MMHDIIKKSIFCRLAHNFIIISMQITTLLEFNKTTIKFIWKNKYVRIGKKIIKKE